MKFFLSLILTFVFFSNIQAEQTEQARSEIGFWLGAANPFPGSPTSRVLDTTLGFGVIGRTQWPYTLYTEAGIYAANHLSQTERGLTVAPAHLALAYKLPFEQLPVSIFLKAGGGAAYVIARPANTAKWDPLAMLGAEVSFVAGKKVRIGLRMDYYRIFETYFQQTPEETRRIYLSPFDRDYRLYNPNYYKLQDAELFNFSLMVSFLL
ncbi:MAG: hypothetical protein SFU98_04435 [Leptospiraceae bacterium]|nr:hypothetical protein [Leptospiraceae bacterium]